MESINKKYLGDGVYFEYDGFSVILTTSNGFAITNEIYLEPAVLDNLLSALVKEDDIPRN